jgi:hypothetical protein
MGVDNPVRQLRQGSQETAWVFLSGYDSIQFVWRDVSRFAWCSSSRAGKSNHYGFCMYPSDIDAHCFSSSPDMSQLLIFSEAEAAGSVSEPLA